MSFPDVNDEESFCVCFELLPLFGSLTRALMNVLQHRSQLSFCSGLFIHSFIHASCCCASLFTLIRLLISRTILFMTFKISHNRIIRANIYSTSREKWVEGKKRRRDEKKRLKIASKNAMPNYRNISHVNMSRTAIGIWIPIGIYHIDFRHYSTTFCVASRVKNVSNFTGNNTQWSTH